MGYDSNVKDITSMLPNGNTHTTFPPKDRSTQTEWAFSFIYLLQLFYSQGVDTQLLDYLKYQASRTTHDTTYQNKIARDNFYWSKDWRHKRAAILIRDNSECQVCKSLGKVTINAKLIIHHIKLLEFFPDSRLADSNLIAVCLDCHNIIHGLTSESKYNDEWW